MSDPAIVIDDVTKSYGANQVLRGISLEIPEGTTLALLGRNGAGKTTAIRILMGLVPADSGAVSICGVDPVSDPIGLRRNVGYLAEDQRMYGWMNAIELCQFLAPFYATWDMQWASDFLNRFEIPTNIRISKLSKGQVVKLGLAVALAHRPRGVILDDPAMGLDPISRKEFNRDLVEHLQASGATVLYSSHLLDEVEAVADAVAILDQGRIVRFSQTDQLRDDVKQIIVRASALQAAREPEGLLDVRRHHDQLVLTTSDANRFSEHLASTGVEHEVVDLRLDEIFEAYVIGKKNHWPTAEPPVAHV